MKPTILLSALLIAALPGLAFSADKDIDSTKRIDQRQDRQDKRIDKGAKSGDITKNEAKRLENRQDRIDAAEKKAMKDKKMTKEERARIERMQDQQSRDIKRQSSDKQERGAAARKSSASAGASTAATAAAAGNLGKLSPAQQDAFIKEEERKAGADGVVSPEEQARLNSYYKQVQNPWRFDGYRNRDRTRD